MNYEGAILFLTLFANVDVFLVVFVRVMGFFTVLPVVSGQNMPVMARIGLALGIAMLAFTTNAISLPSYHFSIMGFGMLLASEFMIGLIIGFVVMMMFSLFHFVGQLVDYQMGFSMVSVHDPLGQTQAPVTGNLYFLIVCVFFIATGVLNHIIWIVFESFGIIDIGAAQIIDNADLVRVLVEIIVVYFVTGVRIALPIVGTLIIVDVVLGILVKAVPQMNVFIVGLPLKVFLGTILVYLTMPLLAPRFWNVVDNINVFIMEAMRRMMP